MNFPRKRLAAFSLLTFAWIMVAVNTSAAAISKGYETDDKLLVPGMVVSLVADSTSKATKVERAVQGSTNRVIGIASDTNESLVTVASGSSQAYVENEGEVRAFTSDLNGEIKKGDLLTLSPLRGILMRADDQTGFIVAIAAEDFTAKSAEAYSITGADETSTLIQRIRVNLDYKGTSVKQGSIDSSIQRLGTIISGRDVGIIRPIIALVIFLLIMIVEGSILYGAISSAITSVGRNPLAKQVIFKELIRVFFIVAGVLLVGLLAIYAVLLV